MICLTQKTAIDIAVSVGDVLCPNPLTFTAAASSEPDSLALRIEDPATGTTKKFVLSYRRTVQQFESVCRSVTASNLSKLRVESGRARDEQAEAEWLKTRTA